MFKRFGKIFYTSICTYMSDEEMLSCMKEKTFNPYTTDFKETYIKPIYLTITEYTEYLEEILELDLEKPIKLDPVDMEQIEEIPISRFYTDRDKLIIDPKQVWDIYMDVVMQLT